MLHFKVAQDFFFSSFTNTSIGIIFSFLGVVQDHCRKLESTEKCIEGKITYRSCTRGN